MILMNYKNIRMNGLNTINNERINKGKMCCSRTPMETLVDGKNVGEEKNLAQI